MRPTPLDVTAVRVLLCDADDCLFASEGPAFAASTGVTNRCLAELGIDRAFGPDELRREAAGKNFRRTIEDLAHEHGVAGALTPPLLERWVVEEQRVVTDHLRSKLRPVPAVSEPLTRLAERYALAVVSSSATGRLAACFSATGLDELFPADVRFSAESSLPEPVSKPDPAIYTFAGDELGVRGAEALAIEDSVSGARSAVAAGFPTIGNVMFVAGDERAERTRALHAAGVAAIVESWAGLEELLAR